MMKPKTFDLLLEFYIKERLPSEDISEASANSAPQKDVPLGVSFAQSTPPPRRSTSAFFQDGKQNRISPREGALQHIDCTNFEVQADEIDMGDLDPEIREKCKQAAKKLVLMSDGFELSHFTPSVEQMDDALSNCTEEEQNALRKIFAEGTSKGLSQIASILSSCFTPQTLQATIRFVTGHNEDISRQLAITLELSARMVRVKGTKTFKNIHDVVAEVFQDRTELEDL